MRFNVIGRLERGRFLQRGIRLRSVSRNLSVPDHGSNKMRVLLISPNTEKINIPVLPLGLACVAAATHRAGHVVSLLDLMAEGNSRQGLRRAIEGFRPEIIGVSVRNIDDQKMENPKLLLDPVREIVTICRGLTEAPVILGGAGYSIFPEAVLSFSGADMGIQGEGEIVFPELVERLGKGASLSGLPGLYLRGYGLQCERVFAKGLDELPLPGPDLWINPSQTGEALMPVQTRRGCALGCSYCSTGTIEGRLIRRRSSDALIEWMTRWHEAGTRRFYFVDNTFNLPVSYAKEICRKLIDHSLGIRWWSIVYPKGIDEELARLMAGAGCEQVSLGFESGSEQILKKMNKRFLPDEVREASELFFNQGIKQMGFLLLGGPGETRKSVEESRAFADSLRIDSLKITAGIRIYPQTDLARQALDEGLISDRDDLLSPRFYLQKGLEGWLPETLKDWMVTRPHWTT